MGKLIPIIAYISMGAVLLLAGFFFFLGARNIWRGLASPQWPKAIGTVATSESQSETTVDDKTDRTDVMYGATIVFNYTVNSRSYTTPLLYFGQTLSSGDPTEAQLRLLRYPKGAQVDIFYNPSDPSIAAAEPGFHAESLLLLLAGLMFGLPCIMGMIFIGGFSQGGAVNNLGMAICAALFAFIFATLGTGALTLGLINLWRAHASETWPKAPGVITYQTLDASQVDVPREGDDRHTDVETTYSDHLVFTYEVDGKKRFSNLRRFGLMAAGSQDEADTIKERYPANMAVTVFYSPDNPNLGVLEPGVDQETWWLPGIGLAVLLFALAVCIWIVPAVANPFGS